VSVALAAADPAVVVLRAPVADGVPESHPAYGKVASPAGAAAYVCRGSVCGLPVTEPDALAALLATRSGG
jgi:hypothetical protein